MAPTILLGTNNFDPCLLLVISKAMLQVLLHVLLPKLVKVKLPQTILSTLIGYVRINSYILLFLDRAMPNAAPLCLPLTRLRKHGVTCNKPIPADLALV